MSREITSSNYDFKCKEVEKVLENAKFVSFDTEVTGFECDNDDIKKFGLFDSTEELYLKVKKNIKQFLIVQLGITAFCYDKEENKYVAYSYVFYVYPRSVASFQKTFLIQGSVLEFLSQSEFDFNKVVFKGVSCLNLEEEKIVTADIIGEKLVSAEERPISREEEDLIQAQCSQLALWVGGSKEGDTWKVVDFDYSRKMLVYLLTKEIQKRFLDVWTDLGEDGTILVRRVTDHSRGQLLATATKEKTCESQLIDHFIGVSHIWKLLSQLKKPIVGSSPLLDLMMMYQQFHKPLPSSYKEFKVELHAVFPHIYDTKYLGYGVQEMCASLAILMDEGNGLAILKTYFVPGKGAALPVCDPPITLAGSSRDVPSTITQHTGWDSYYTGCCLIRIAHFLAKKNRYGCGLSEQPPGMTVAHLFSVSVKPYKNRIHIAPANVSYMCLDGHDPLPDKPQTLHLRCMSRFATNDARIVEDLSETARQSIQVRTTSGKEATVVVNSMHSAGQVLRWCESHWNYKVQETKEVNVMRSLLMGGALGLTCAIAMKLYKSVSSSLVKN